MAFVPGYGMRAAGDVKILHDHVLLYDVAVPCESLHFICAAYGGFGPIAVWIGMAADWSLRSILFTIRFKSGKWLNHHLIEERTGETKHLLTGKRKRICKRVVEMSIFDRGWKPYRINHLSWWKEELASEEEMEEGRNNLAAHDNRNVDEKKILLYEQIIRVV